MLRALLCGPCLVLAVIGCRLPPDQRPLQPLPEEGQVYSYGELLGRARVQAQIALEAFYIDGWLDLEEAAQGLAQTARFLPKSVEQPASHKDEIVLEARRLGKEANRLREAARAKNISVANEALQQINLKIRTLRPPAEPPPALPPATKESPAVPPPMPPPQSPD
jgi:hypothetical protein